MKRDIIFLFLAAQLVAGCTTSASPTYYAGQDLGPYTRLDSAPVARQDCQIVGAREPPLFVCTPR
jgi:hypothetical protein